MRRASTVATILVGIIQYCLVTGAEAVTTECPKFSKQAITKPLKGTDRLATFEGGAVAMVGGLLVDADGAATAYHPKGDGIDTLCNGVAPYINGKCVAFKNGKTDKLCYQTVEKAQKANWVRASSPPMCIFGFEVPSNPWGGTYGNGELEVQGPTEPAPGFFRSTTAFSLNPKKWETWRQYVNADVIPYVAVPTKFTAERKLALKGGAAVVVELNSQREVLAIVGDTKKEDRLGEVSIAVAQLLQHPELKDPVPLTTKQLETKEGIEPPYKVKDGVVRAIVNPNNGPYMIFTFGAKAGLVESLELSAVRQFAGEAVAKFGGREHLVECARRFFESTK